MCALLICSSTGCGSEPPEDYVVTAFDLYAFPVEKLTLAPGQSVALEVIVDHWDAPSADVSVTVSGLPSGVTAAPLTIAGESGLLQLRVDQDAPLVQAAVATLEAVHVDYTAELNLELSIVPALSPGMVDHSFGIGGVASLDLPVDGADMLVQPDGKILLTAFGPYGDSRLVIARFDEDGALDTEFGDAGMAFGDAPPGFGQLRPLSVAQLTDGSLVLLAARLVDTERESLLYRFTADGVATYPVFLSESAMDLSWSGLVLDSADRLMLLGNGGAVGRFSPDGIVDPSYGDKGYVLTNLTWLRDFVMLGDDVFMLAQGDDGDGGPFVARISPDATVQTYGFGDDIDVRALGLDAVDGLVVAGGRFSAARLDLSLAVDQAFGQPWAVVDAGVAASDAIVLAGGDVLIAGDRELIEPAVIGRLSSTGDLVPFDLLTTIEIPVVDTVAAMRLSIDGQLLIGGSHRGRAIVARLVL
jgi:hypothetical protein